MYILLKGGEKKESEGQWYEIGCQLHTGFGLVPTWMTSNDLERRNNPFYVFTEFECFAGQIRHSG